MAGRQGTVIQYKLSATTEAVLRQQHAVTNPDSTWYCPTLQFAAMPVSQDEAFAGQQATGRLDAQECQVNRWELHRRQLARSFAHSVDMTAHADE